jgi:tRNA-dihydrouridine synthase A
MMDWSDRHCRFFWRLLSKHARLYTEMVTTGAILHGDKNRFLDFSPQEHPIALQLGGSDPEALAQCSAIAEDWGYDEVNLNCGCPSDRVQKGKIGAILMREPELVSDCVSAMQERCTIPITVKHRIGVDEDSERDTLFRFVEIVRKSGCTTFIVHARKAWLKGLSPKENREIPPLRYELVNELKQSFPDLTIVINGGLNHMRQCQTLLDTLDGVMIGREAYSNPYMLSEVDKLLFDSSTTSATRAEVLEEYAQYCESQLSKGLRLHHMSRHILGLYAAQTGAKRFRRYISEYAPKHDAGVEVLHNAIKLTEP